MRRLHGRVDLRLVDDHRDPDLGGGDHLDVDTGRGEGGEELRGDAGVGAHPGADEGDLADPVVVAAASRSRPRRGSAPARPWRPGRRRAAA